MRCLKQEHRTHDKTLPIGEEEEVDHRFFIVVRFFSVDRPVESVVRCGLSSREVKVVVGLTFGWVDRDERVDFPVIAKDLIMFLLSTDLHNQQACSPCPQSVTVSYINRVRSPAMALTMMCFERTWAIANVEVL